ncbi:MAG: cation-translocating P-type ATPase [Acidimicrobiales bacterium]
MALDATVPVARLLRDLRTTPRGLSNPEAGRRLTVYGRNVLVRRGGHRLWREFARQFTHPLALLLWAAAGLAWLGGIVAVAIAIVIVIVLNAMFAFFQEMQAERSVEALQSYLPQHAKVLRDDRLETIESALLVPGDVLMVEEGDRISADARLLTGTLEIDASALTGESVPVTRDAAWSDTDVPLLQARDLVFSGTTCTGGNARAAVIATGMRTELGRIAALSERVHEEPSPLDQQVRKVAWLISVIAVIMAIAFLPVATLGGGLTFSAALVMTVGLIAGNVPEGLLPVITLALAIGVRDLARRNAVVKRLSAVETLGSTSVICTDKTGTLTQNHMQVTRLWTSAGGLDLSVPPADAAVAMTELLAVLVLCNNATPATGTTSASGDPTELALLETAAALGAPVDAATRERDRVRDFRFDPRLKLMTTVDQTNGSLRIDTKGAPEAVLPLCTRIMAPDGTVEALDAERRRTTAAHVDNYAAAGLRVLAFATRTLPTDSPPPEDRDAVERDLCLVGLAAMQDPPRPEVAAAVAACHEAGIRIIVVTGDHPLTAAAVARQVGIGGEAPTVVTGAQLNAMSEKHLDDVLRADAEIIFARTSPEAKLRIADALRAEGHIIAMTGDGVNDAPALRRADIGVAMGLSGTDVAREASAMVLTDDNFATIVTAIEAGRRVYDNIRKFILYIFAHATPEILPFLVFALARGAVPLPLTVLQLLCFDVGTETLPALALGREPAEPGLMLRPPRPPSEGVIRPAMLLRAWLFLGLIAAILAMCAFFVVLVGAGWEPHAPVGPGHALHHAYLQATTVTFLSMVMAQIGTAFAARTERASLRTVGVFSNPFLLWGIAFELALAAILIYTPSIADVLGMAPLPPRLIALTLPFPFIVWGADELRRYLIRRRSVPGAGKVAGRSE